MTGLLEMDIKPVIDLDKLAQRLHIKADTYIFSRTAELVDMALDLARPQYVIRSFPVGKTTEKGVFLGGQELCSRILADKLGGGPEAWAYIATAGREICDCVDQARDALDKYLLDQIACFCCHHAMTSLLNRVQSELGLCRCLLLSPGSLIDWGVIEVKKLFILLEGDYQQIGVRVLDSGLIAPLKSVSGVLIDRDDDFQSCDICSRKDCPNRTSEFDAEKHCIMTKL